MSPEHSAINADEQVTTPVRPAMLPYGRQSISDEDIQAVVGCYGPTG